jgi:hypothetical protein
LEPLRAYIERGKAAIPDLLEREHAVVWPEVEAKLADRQHNAIDPDVLTKARQELEGEALIESTLGPTRGGRQVAVWHFRDLSGRRTTFDAAAGRKRLLYARFQSWNASSRRYPQGLIGAAGEIVFHESLLEATPYGYNPLHRKRAQVNSFFGGPVEGGPLDSAAFLQVLEDGRPAVIALPVEVKNIRHWLYPESSELFQVLYKGARLQSAHPDYRFVPVVVSRRRAYYTWEMGKELGYLPIQTRAQFLLPRAEVDRHHFDQVKKELGYTDLVLTEKAHPGTVAALRDYLPKHAFQLSERWKVCGPPLADHFDVLRTYVAPDDRRSLMAGLRAAASGLPGCDVYW